MVIAGMMLRLSSMHLTGNSTDVAAARRAGYIVFQFNKSTVITATDEQRLAAAVKRFIETSRQHNGKR
jgi:hypothetical protein